MLQNLKKLLIFVILLSFIEVTNSEFSNINADKNITFENNTLLIANNSTIFNNTILPNVTTENIYVITNDDINNHRELFIPKGQLLEPHLYPEGTCELAAKTFQKEYSGYLVFIVPIDSNGEWIAGKFSGAWLNKIYHNNETIFIDYGNQKIYKNKESLYIGMKNTMKNKFNNNIDIKIYIYGIDEMPYPIIWNY